MTLGKLICGSPSSECIANTTLDQLSNSIDRFSNKAIVYLNNDFNDEAQIFGAFCARVVLENASAALVGRFDPFRMLYLSEFQAQGGFEYGRPAKSGFKWSGDVLPIEKSTQELWSTQNDISKISRALFSEHSSHMYWSPAVECALDFIGEDTTTGNFSDLIDLEPSEFVSVTKGKCKALYSKLSKGVHWEFFVSSVIMDETTIKDSIRDTFVNLAKMGFISHFAPTAYRSLNHEIAADTYRNFRGTFE